MKKKVLALIMALTAVMIGFTACSGDDSTSSGEKETWKLAHTESQDTMYDMWANQFAKLVNEKSDGRITVEVYPVGQLGDSAAQLEMIQTGGIDMGIFASGDVGSTFPAAQALSLNFLFSEDNKVNSAVLTKGEATAKLNEMFEEKGIHVYDWLSLGNMQWTSNSPLKTPMDFDGFKMRIMASPLIAANYEALGASPTNVAFMETYSALQLKTVDGTEQPLNAIEEMKFYEVQDYITMSNHAQMASFVAFNADFYNSLSDEDKEIVESVREEMEKFAADSLETVLQEKFDAIMAEKPDMQVIELTEEERQAFIDKSMEVREDIVEYAGEEGKEIMELVIKDVEKYEKEING